ncbi:MAG: type IV pilus secretin PilQ [Deltaproteobacteria bacterium]|nr:MAG: type IV pilus secretin PilQ [Deltaproteobacteria bacterium]
MNGVKIMADKVRRAGRTYGVLGMLLCCVAGVLAVAGNALGAQVPNQLLAVKMEEGAASPTVLIQTAEAVGYRYTVYDSFDPVRVVIDFPGMAAEAVVESIPAGPAPLKELKVAKFDLASGKLARVEIVLGAAADYQVALDGKNFRVVFPGLVAATAPPRAAEPQQAQAAVAPVPAAPAAAAEKPPVGQAATVIREVTTAPGRVLLATNGSVGRYEHFTLGNPPRLVVDLYGLLPGFKQRTFDVAGGMKKVRVGAYGDKVRFVFDADGKALPEHTVEKLSDGVAVSWVGGLQGGGAPQETPATAVVAPAAGETPAKATRKAAPVGRQVAVENLEFVNREGRSYVVATLTGAASLSKPVQDGNLVRFEIRNATISRSLRRTIDASAFPSAVKSVTPYVVKDDGKPGVRIAIELKGSVPFTLVDEGTTVKMVIDDGAYAEALPPDVTTKEVVAAGSAKSAPTATNGRKADEPQGPRYTGQKISLVFDNADIRSILQLIGDVSGLNIIASDDVKGEVTLRLIDVPWDQALELVLDTAGLRQDREGNVLRIMTVKEATQRHAEKMKARVEQAQAENVVTSRRTVQIQYINMDRVKSVVDDYSKISGKDGAKIAANFDKASKKVLLAGPSSQLDDLVTMIEDLDRPEQQVMIEARIVEAKTNFLRELGVNWGIHYDNDGATTESNTLNNANLGLGGAFALTPPAAGIGGAGSVLGMSFGTLGVNSVTLDVRLSALESSGDGKVVSTPKVTTLNGSQATIEQGRSIPYTTISDDGAKTEFKDAKLILKVTPEINPNGTMILDLDISNDSAGAIVPTGSGTAVSIESKKAKTKLMLNSGDTTVVGGVYVDITDDSESGVPWLKDIPYLGYLFKSTRKSKERRELLIFITPRILAPLEPPPVASVAR